MLTCLKFYIPIYFLDFYICMLFYISLELENDLGEVETSFAFIADFYYQDIYLRRKYFYVIKVT